MDRMGSTPMEVPLVYIMILKMHHARTHTHAPARARARTHTHTHTHYTHARTHASKHARTHARTHAPFPPPPARTYMHTHAHAHTCTAACAHASTSTVIYVHILQTRKRAGMHTQLKHKIQHTNSHSILPLSTLTFFGTFSRIAWGTVRKYPKFTGGPLLWCCL